MRTALSSATADKLPLVLNVSAIDFNQDRWYQITVKH